MKLRGLIASFTGGSLLLISACATLAPPSQPGVSDYLSGDKVAAYEALAPLADKNDPTAQYYAAKIILEQAPRAPSAERTRALSWLLASAGAGNQSAYSLVIALAMKQEQRAEFLQTITIKKYSAAELSNSLMPDSQFQAATRITYDERTIAFIEQIAGGPVLLISLSEIAGNVTAIENGTLTPPDSAITDGQLTTIDEQLAHNGDQYGQARMAQRYAVGRGVNKDLAQALSLNLSAAKSRPAPRSCVYQAPVGNGSGSTYCYDTGQPTAGLPSAILEVCKAYAFGVGVEQNRSKARDWCERAAKSGETKTQANQILQNLASE